MHPYFETMQYVFNSVFSPVEFLQNVFFYYLRCSKPGNPGQRRAAFSMVTVRLTRSHHYIHTQSLPHQLHISPTLPSSIHTHNHGHVTMQGSFSNLFKLGQGAWGTYMNRFFWNLIVSFNSRNVLVHFAFWNSFRNWASTTSLCISLLRIVTNYCSTTVVFTKMIPLRRLSLMS